MLMRLRIWLVVLIVASTAAFVVGTTLERGDSGHTESAPATSSTGSAEAAGGEEGGGESAAHRAAEGTGGATVRETHSELKPLGVDVEAVPFVLLAALMSLGLAVAAWRRPGSRKLLVAVAVAMLAFGVLDVREVLHQNDEGNTGLAVLAGLVAALHIAAGLVAALMARGATSPDVRGGAAVAQP